MREYFDFSHVGDGNFHCGLIFLPEDFKKADEAAHRMVDRAIALGGTCTGERGLYEPTTRTRRLTGTLSRRTWCRCRKEGKRYLAFGFVCRRER